MVNNDPPAFFTSERSLLKCEDQTVKSSLLITKGVAAVTVESASGSNQGSSLQ